MDEPSLSIWQLVIVAAGFSMLASVGPLLDRGRWPTFRELLASFVNAGMIGAILVMFWYAYLRDNWTLAVATAALIGWAGTSTVRQQWISSIGETVRSVLIPGLARACLWVLQSRASQNEGRNDGREEKDLASGFDRSAGGDGGGAVAGGEEGPDRS